MAVPTDKILGLVIKLLSVGCAVYWLCLRLLPIMCADWLDSTANQSWVPAATDLHGQSAKPVPTRTNYSQQCVMHHRQAICPPGAQRQPGAVQRPAWCVRALRSDLGEVRMPVSRVVIKRAKTSIPPTPTSHHTLSPVTKYMILQTAPAFSGPTDATMTLISEGHGLVSFSPCLALCS